jgi:BirA family transcriptional regulator, biotin operon repressor / biotin---[acetyl-CoA-carboxylase] ligase
LSRDIYWHKSIDSTMRAAAELAGQGCPSGTVVGADEQTAGRGRHGHSWHSEAAAGLYITEILRLPVKPDELPIVTLMLGLAAAEAIFQTCGVQCDLRWPNDVLIGNRKCAGILVQLQDSAMLAGIGINVNQREFPEELRPIATSLRQASGREHSRKDLLDGLLTSIDQWSETLLTEGKEAILRLFTQSSSYVHGRQVVVDQGGSRLEGITDGLSAAGFLILQENNGHRTTILTGGVRPG